MNFCCKAGGPVKSGLGVTGAIETHRDFVNWTPLLKAGYC
jgi:hypothetical protein